MARTLEFYYDYGSPYSYLADTQVEAIAKRAGAVLVRKPMLLGGVFKATNNRSPAQSLVGIKNKPEYERIEMNRFIKRHGITRFKSNPFFPVNTLMMMRGAVAARQLGVFERYVDEMFRNMWGDPKKMDDPAIFRTALDEAGLPTAKIVELIETQPVKDELIANTQRSVERGTFGSPTFYVGDEIFFGKDRLRDVEELIAASK